VLLVGLPGSGKSTWVRQQGGNPLSSDDLRQMLVDDTTDQTIHRVVFKTLRYLLRQRLELGRPVTYIDATNLTPLSRRPFIRLANLYGYEIEAVFFDLPLEICKERNRTRSRVVPEDALDLLAMRLVPPVVEEGFSRVYRIFE
jgi:predicted kinase